MIRRLLLVWLASSVLAVASGCGTRHLTEAGASVRVGKSAPFEDCKELGIVIAAGRTLETALNDLRNKTAARGGDFAVMDSSVARSYEVSMSGRAYDCSAGSHSQAAPVQIVNAPEPKPTPEERLKKLADLRDKGLITPEEYARRREEILKEL